MDVTSTEKILQAAGLIINCRDRVAYALKTHPSRISEIIKDGFDEVHYDVLLDEQVIEAWIDERHDRVVRARIPLAACTSQEAIREAMDAYLEEEKRRYEARCAELAAERETKDRAELERLKRLYDE